MGATRFSSMGGGTVWGLAAVCWEPVKVGWGEKRGGVERERRVRRLKRCERLRKGGESKLGGAGRSMSQ